MRKCRSGAAPKRIAKGDRATTCYPGIDGLPILACTLIWAMLFALAPAPSVAAPGVAEARIALVLGNGGY